MSSLNFRMLPFARDLARAIAVASSLALTIGASAETHVFTVNTTISDTMFDFDDMDIVVRGCTVTINGAHSFASLTVERNASNQPGVVTHTAGFANRVVAGAWLDIAGDVFVQGASGGLVASRIDLNGRGHPSASGPGAGGSHTYAGGGGHGGAGGNGQGGAGGGTYDDFAQPISMGSGGGRDAGKGHLGGAGGGVLRLTIAGTLTVDGSITANGNSYTGEESGAGAGGSIWIECGGLFGSGLITANGGIGNTGWSGGGGGGRIAVHANASSFDLANLRASGGDGWTPGGAGTAWLNSGSLERPVLKVDNNALIGAVTEISNTLEIPGDVILAAGARVGPKGQDPSFHLIIDGDVEVMANASFYANGRGYPSDGGPGAGGSYTYAGGGGHGGAGGNGQGGAGGGTYDDFAQPISMGSGGGRDAGKGHLGGAGGGVLRLTIAGTLAVDGSITANGNSYTGEESGAGAGGSIWIECGGLFGSGLITANGGIGNTGWSGGGGGGRIAVHANASSFDLANLRASGGNGWTPGGAGTAWLNSGSLERPVLKVDNNALIGAVTEISNTLEIPGDVILAAGARVGPKGQDPSFHLIIDGDVEVMANASFYANGRGYPSDGGPGAGGSYTYAGGGGHGGAGGNGQGGAGGGTYDDFAQPISMGSGGGRDAGKGHLGGAGGGVLRLTIAGTLTVDGSITANGNSYTGEESGAGAGGSIWIECGGLFGSGLITANGGIGNTGWSGGGGGGRIAVHANASSFDFANLRASGGNGWTPGGAGTAWLNSGSLARPILKINNNGLTGAVTEISNTLEIPGDAIVAAGARVGPKGQDPSFHLIIDGDVEVLAGASFYANGRGYPSDGGPGAGGSHTYAGGGGHGGAGGNGQGGAGGGTYDDFAQPISMGSGGGRDAGKGHLGGAGGGVLRLTIAGTLTVDGSITANGNSYTGEESGAGAGGSIWIECGGLFGSGLITANGGIGNTGWSGGGGGGRIAISAATLTMPFSAIQTIGGNGWTRGGAGTFWLDLATAPRPALRIDNAGFTGASTEATGEIVIPGDVVVAGAARFGPKQGDSTLHLVIDGDVEVMANASFYANGRGYPSDGGPGAGGSHTYAGGGGHGGAGGNGQGGAGGGTYDDFAQPISMGSGGGRDAGKGHLGGAGGGVLRLTIAGTLTVDGSITANGNSYTGEESGAGAGGSIWIECGGLFGSGLITANGGIGNTGWSGGGGGGRIAIYCCAVEMPEENIRVNGGAGWQAGHVGTVGIFSDSIDFAELPQSLVLDRTRTAVFTVAATGLGELAYQWFKDDDEPLSDGPNIFGATTPMLTITNVTCLGAGGTYRARVTDDCGDAFTPPASLTIPILGDVNGDCLVDGNDLAIVLGAWGPCPGCVADINGDGMVDGNDLVIVLGGWTG